MPNMSVPNQSNRDRYESDGQKFCFWFNKKIMKEVHVPKLLKNSITKRISILNRISDPAIKQSI